MNQSSMNRSSVKGKWKKKLYQDASARCDQAPGFFFFFFFSFLEWCSSTERDLYCKTIRHSGTMPNSATKRPSIKGQQSIKTLMQSLSYISWFHRSSSHNFQHCFSCFVIVIVVVGYWNHVSVQCIWPLNHFPPVPCSDPQSSGFGSTSTCKSHVLPRFTYPN